MTISTTLPPPKEKPWFTCSKASCDNKWQAYNGKIGCLCYSCDEKLNKEKLK